MCPTPNTSAKRTEIVTAATAMINGEIDLIEGVRRIAVLRHYLEDPDDNVLMPIRAIESETDHFPLGLVRAQCAPSYLKQADEEMARYLADAKEDILTACREIVRAYS